MHFATFLVSSILVSLIFAAGGCASQRPSAEPTSSAAANEALPANTAVLWVRGMGCPQCANNVDVQLMKVPGVVDVKIDMGSGRVTATLEPGSHPTREQLAQAIDRTGFTLTRIQMPS